jgi:hypothetical protein
VLAFIDIDSTQKRVYGHKKQGAKFGHTKIQGNSVLVRGLNALVAAVSTPLAASTSTGIRPGLERGRRDRSTRGRGVDQQAVAEYRYRAVREVLGGSPVCEVAQRYGTSRQSLHTWRRRFEAEGMPGPPIQFDTT